MKKFYEPPSAEKISFNYREQVVAASGTSGDGNQEPVRTIFSDGCNIQSLIVLGYDICSSF